MSGNPTPPVPAQRKVKLVTSLKATLADQSAKLHSKHEAEQELLEDIRNYAKQRASIEKDYAQAILKITSQLLNKIRPCAKHPNSTTDNHNDDDNSCAEVEQHDKGVDTLRSPKGLWCKILEETETMANSRLKISQTLQNDIADSIKTLKAERAVTLKKCDSLAEKLQEEVVVSTSDLVKAQKTYSELQRLTNQARQHASDAQEKLQSGKVSILSSRAKLERNASKSNERRDASEKRSTVARNEYLLNLAAINAHLRKYYSQDMPDLIALQDGKIYENLKDYYGIITDIEREASKEFLKNLDNIEGHIKGLERAYVVMCFLKENTVFTKCEPYEYSGVVGDEVSKISDEYGAGLTLNKEARKWTLRLAREQKAIRNKTNKLKGLRAMSLVDMNISSSRENVATLESAKTTEQSIESLTEEIRHLEVLKTKAEGRVEALKLAGVNVDEWLQQGSTSEQDEDNDALNNNQSIDDEFNDEWDDNLPTYSYDNYSDDGMSVSSSVEQKLVPNIAVALYPFDANSQEELTIIVGEELELLETENDGWCRTRNKSGEVGFVPETYIEVKRSNTMSDDGDSLSKVSSHASSGVSEIQIDYSGASINYSDVETTPTPLTMGFHSPPTPITPIAMDYPDLDSQSKFICFAKAIYGYDAIEEEELSFHEGDTIMITSKIVDDDDGWWEGVLNGKRGVFPCLLVEETKSDPLLRSQDDNAMSQNMYLEQTDIYRSQTLGSNDISGFKSLLNRDNGT